MATTSQPTRGDPSTPVPFSVVDEAVHLLDTESEPWSIQLEVRVGGHLDEDRLRAAITEGLGRHPMARARRMASRRSDRAYRWEITPALDLDPLRAVDCPDDDALAAARAQLQSLSVPVLESPPLRIRLARHPDGDVVMCNVNHAAMDGFGGLRVLRSIARAYAGAPDPLPDLDPLAARDLPAGLAANSFSTRARRYRVLLEKMRDQFSAPARLAADGGSNRPGYGFHHIALAASTTETLVGLDHPGTVNDVLLAALHLAIAGWNAEHGARTGRIAVMVPMNFRPRDWWDEVGGNFSLMVRFSTDGADRSDPASALRAITSQTDRTKRGGTGAALIEVLSRSPLIPLWFKEASRPLLWLTGNRLVDTALLTNLGRLGSPPDFGADAGPTTEVWFSAPARMPLGVSLGAVTACGRLHLAFRYRHPLLGAGAARRFAGGYLDALDLLIAAGARGELRPRRRRAR